MYAWPYLRNTVGNPFFFLITPLSSFGGFRINKFLPFGRFSEAEAEALPFLDKVVSCEPYSYPLTRFRGPRYRRQPLWAQDALYIPG